MDMTNAGNINGVSRCVQVLAESFARDKDFNVTWVRFTHNIAYPKARFFQTEESESGDPVLIGLSDRYMSAEIGQFIDVNTVAILNKNGFIAITLVILMASTMPDSSSPGLTIYRINGSANIIISTDVIKVRIASKFSSDDDNSHADFLLPDAKR